MSSRSPSKTLRRRTAVSIVVLLGVVLTSACDDPAGYPRAKAGAKCAKDGAMARDATFVLQCKKNKRWTRIMTIAQAQSMLAAFQAAERAKVIAAQPTVPPPTAPPAPPVTAPYTPPPLVGLTSFGAVNTGIGNANGWVQPGQYVTITPPGQTCSWETTDEYGDVAGGFTSFRGQMFLPAHGDAVHVSTTGPCQWANAAGARPLIDWTGMARVGVDLAKGTYRAPGGANCYWEVDDRDDGFLDSIIENNFGPGAQMVDLDYQAQVFITDGCGPWTLVTNAETRRVRLTSTATDPILDGGSRGYTDAVTPIQMTGTQSDITVTADGWSIRLQAPTGQTFSQLLGGDVYSQVARDPDATHAGLYFSGNGGTCTVVDGSMSVNLTMGPGSVPFRLEASFVQHCDGVGTSFGRISYDPVMPL